ncbi:hypothetical protein JCM10296v2_000655 [Rhodotorula toruloides]
MSLSEILRRVSILPGAHVDEDGLVDKRVWEANARRYAKEKADELLAEKAKAKTSREPFHNIEWPCDRRTPPPSSTRYVRNPYDANTSAKSQAAAKPTPPRKKPQHKFSSRSRLRHRGAQLNAGDYNKILEDAETFVTDHDHAVPLAKAYNERARTAKEETAEQGQDSSSNASSLVDVRHSALAPDSSADRRQGQLRASRMDVVVEAIRRTSWRLDDPRSSAFAWQLVRDLKFSRVQDPALDETVWKNKVNFTSTFRSLTRSPPDLHLFTACFESCKSASWMG